MRLQTMTLPNPDAAGRYPFVLIIDRLDGLTVISNETRAELLETTGARGVLIFDNGVEVETE